MLNKWARKIDRTFLGLSSNQEHQIKEFWRSRSPNKSTDKNFVVEKNGLQSEEAEVIDASKGVPRSKPKFITDRWTLNIFSNKG